MALTPSPFNLLKGCARLVQSSVRSQTLSQNQNKAFLLTRPVVKFHPRSARYYASASASASATSSSASSASRMGDNKGILEGLDPVQEKLLAEECILLDKDDRVIGHDSKKNCHLIKNNGDIPLHRAFSVFLFNSKGQLLVQQRSKTKITFPLLWTNTCCSHPLFCEDELREKDAHGVRIAARRRLENELGIPQDAIKPEEFHYLTRIHYKAASNKVWGEHEIDYILFLQKDLELKPNPDEVAEVRYVDFKEIGEMKGAGLTPWFELIYKTWLPLWWKNLEDLDKYKDHENIHRM